MHAVPKTNAVKIWLAAILVLAFLLRFPGIFWGEMLHKNSDILEPDERQHVDLAIHFQKKLDPSVFPDFELVRRNTLAFSAQIALASYPFVRIFGSNYKVMLLTGRCLSVIYGVLLTWLMFRLAWLAFGQARAALWAAGGMAVFDLGVTYSHYAVPESAYLFWAMLSVFFGIRFLEKLEGETLSHLKKSWKDWLWMTAAMGMTLALKFDFLPCLLVALVAGWRIIRKQLPVLPMSLFALASIPALFFFFNLGVCFQTDWSDFFQTFDLLVNENMNVIPKDNHSLHNPILYLAGTVAGIGLPATLLALLGARKAAFFTGRFRVLALVGLFTGLEFLMLWRLDGPFVRRCLIFLPFAALLSGWGASHLMEWKGQAGKLLLAAAAFYTLALTVVSQWNFVADNRYQARTFLQQPGYVSKGKHVDFYANINGIPNLVYMPKSDMIVLHETMYSRYWKSFTTPFKIPECCEEIYHCNMDDCRLFQSLLAGTSDFQLIKKFEPFDWAPERRLYKRIFGTYETFLGDVLIFEKRQS